ncbi:hypothetical protein AAHC03_0619 [Spirometra sp. Aus1]
MYALVFTCWTWVLSPTLASEVKKLELFFQDAEGDCQPGKSIYDVYATIDAAVQYATAHTNGHLTTKDIYRRFTYTPGCSRSHGQQIKDIISLLRSIRTQANTSTAYSVFVGPSLRSDCSLLADWMPLGHGSIEAYRNLYQISYICQNNEPARYFAALDRIRSTVRTGIVSFTVNIQSNTLIRALNLFLRQKGWKNIVILYEVSKRVLRYRELAWSLNLYLKTSAAGRSKLNVFTVASLRFDIDPRRTVSEFGKSSQAIILLAGPSISYYFIDMVGNMSIFKNCETAIIQVDPSNIITYDVLRLWRYLLWTREGLGAAAQCTFMMTALPAGHGFDISSYILESKFKVSLASAAALAIRLTYLNYAESGGVPPANTSLFAQIGREPFSVPVLPNVTYDFSNYDGDTVDFYDLYIFTFTPAISARAANITGLHFEGLFDLDGVLLRPNWSVKTVYHNIRPSQGCSPKIDSCLLSPCLEGTAGMNFLHKSCVKVHGRLKSSNCVINVRWVLKVTDFGVGQVQKHYGIIHQDDPEELLWTAPEILRHPLQHPLGTQKGDVYSFAIIAHELFCHSPPFGDCDLTASDILERIRSGTPVFRPRIEEDSIAPAIKEVIEISWEESPECRPTFEQIGKTFHMIGNGRDVSIVDHMLTLMQKYSAKLETEVQERTVKLEEEKQKTEDLIAKMLPLPVAQALVAGNPVDPEAFDDVTIYFSDIVDFSLISAKSTPMQIVDLLNDIYSTFDASIEHFDVYKVETIGDGYMVASGLPIRNGKLHAGEVATMALELLNLSGSLVIRHLPDVSIRLRMGIHSGACVAGVIGLKMPRYCLFGDTVNTASRMKSSGEGGRIHVSPSTKAILEELGGYHLNHRGKVILRGRGEIDSYWLVGKEKSTNPLPEAPDSFMKSRSVQELQLLGMNDTETNGHLRTNISQCSKPMSSGKLSASDIRRWLQNAGNHMSPNNRLQIPSPGERGRPTTPLYRSARVTKGSVSVMKRGRRFTREKNSKTQSQSSSVKENASAIT